MYAQTFRGCFCSQRVTVAIWSQPLAKSRLNASMWQTHHKLNNHNLGVHTLPVYQYTVHKLKFLLLSHKFIFNSSECNFSYLSAQHMSDPVLNQDHRYQYNLGCSIQILPRCSLLSRVIYFHGTHIDAFHIQPLLGWFYTNLTINVESTDKN